MASSTTAVHPAQLPRGSTQAKQPLFEFSAMPGFMPVPEKERSGSRAAASYGGMPRHAAKAVAHGDAATFTASLPALDRVVNDTLREWQLSSVE